MSRLYNMAITIKEHDTDKSEKIFSAIGREWNIHHETLETSSLSLFAYGEGYLGGGETEEQFVDRLATAIWKANNNYCHVEVEATYLEDLPFETHIRNRENYEKEKIRKRSLQR